jgi:beta-lactamase regulating signal transducer with metallopeptidase domain
MSGIELQAIAGLAIERILNSLPEGILIAVFAWGVLRLLPRQNAGTRFAVWFAALLAVVGLCFFDISPTHPLAEGASHPLFTFPELWGIVLLAVWGGAALVAVTRLVAGLWGLIKMRRSCAVIDAASLDPAVRKTLADFGSSRRVTLAASESVSVPAAIGFFRPMIVVPAWSLRELPADELRIVLLHELAHVRRWDDWTNLFQKFVRAILFLHPAVWWIERRLSLEREMACDDAVLAETANPQGYAKCLISLLEKNFARRNWVMAQAVVHRAREASLRLAGILDANRPRPGKIWKPALGFTCALAVGCLVIASHNPEIVAFGTSGPVHADSIPAGAASPADFDAAVIPASFSMSQSGHVSRARAARTTALKSSASSIAKQSTQKDENRALTTQALPTMLRSQPLPIEVIMAKATAPREALPQTVFVIQTSEEVGPNGALWSVSVWRLTIVDAEHSPLPPAKKI